MKRYIPVCNHAFVVLLLCCGLFFPASLSAADRVITVSATGSQRYNPDTAEFMVTVVSTSKEAAKAAEKVAGLYASLRKELLKAGIVSTDIASVNYSMNPEWEWASSTKSRVFKGYTARHVVRVTLRELPRLGGAIDAVFVAGVGNVENLRYYLSGIEAVRHVALAMAVKSAKKDAEVMASAAGGTLGSLLELEYGQSRPVVPVMRALMSDGANASPGTELQPEEQELTLSVNSRWQFLPADKK